MTKKKYSREPPLPKIGNLHPLPPCLSLFSLQDQRQRSPSFV